MSDGARLPEGHEDSPEWTAADFGRARPAGEVHPAVVATGLVRNKGGRPRGSDKEMVSIRLDRDVLERFRASGPGWQTRINEALRKVGS